MRGLNPFLTRSVVLNGQKMNVNLEVGLNPFLTRSVF